VGNDLNKPMIFWLPWRCLTTRAPGLERKSAPVNIRGVVHKLGTEASMHSSTKLCRLIDNGLLPHLQPFPPLPLTNPPSPLVCISAVLIQVHCPQLCRLIENGLLPHYSPKSSPIYSTHSPPAHSLTTCVH